MKFNVTDFPQHGTNPYSGKTEVLIPAAGIRVASDYETFNTQAISSSSFVSEEDLSKIYVNSVSKNYALSKSGKKVFNYLFNSIDRDKINFKFNLEACMEYCEYKSNKVPYNALAELLKAGIISRTEYDSNYYYHPVIFKRLTKLTVVQEYILKPN